MMIRGSWIPLLFVVLSCGSANVPTDFSTLFAPGVISTPMEEYRIAIDTDGRTVYFARSEEFFPASRKATILRAELVDGKWTPPTIASFSGTYPDIDPFISPDGKRLYFSSIRPVDGEQRTDLDLWYVERTPDGWSEPRNLGEVNSRYDELYPSVAPDGTLYFGSNRPGGSGGWDIWKALPGKDLRYGPAIHLPNVNSAADEFNPAISPDGRYLVFTSIGRTENLGMGDLYVSWRNGPYWSLPVRLNPRVNTPADEYHPVFSPDGRGLYFVRRVSPERGGDIYVIPWSLVAPF
jgi:Tol biopolymer transport system component